MEEPTIQGLLEAADRGAYTDWRTGLALAQRVQAVLRLHRHDGDDPGKRCCNHCNFAWPCATVIALNGGE